MFKFFKFKKDTPDTPEKQLKRLIEGKFDGTLEEASELVDMARKTFEVTQELCDEAEAHGKAHKDCLKYSGGGMIVEYVKEQEARKSLNSQIIWHRMVIEAIDDWRGAQRSYDALREKQRNLDKGIEQ